MRSASRLAALSLGVVCCCFAADEQRPIVDEIDNAVSVRLQQIESSLSQGDWRFAAGELRRLIDEDDDRVVETPLDAVSTIHGFHSYVTLREFLQIRLANAARERPDVLRAYRQHVDAAARRLFERGAAAHDPRLLADVAERFFLSEVGDDAALLLGDLALERGDYVRARVWWERLRPELRFPKQVHVASDVGGLPLWLPLRQVDLARDWQQVSPLLKHSAAPSWLTHPDSNIDANDLRARVLLASIWEGNGERSEIELELLKRFAPAAVGQIGGRRGPYVDLLTEMLDEVRNTHPTEKPVEWLTFAGRAARDGHATEFQELSSEPLWTAPLPQLSGQGVYHDEGQRVAEDLDGLLSYHPIIHGETVAVATGPSVDDVELRDLRSGEVIVERGSEVEPFENQPRYVGVPRLTLSASNGLLVARAGTPITGFRRGRDDDDLQSTSKLVAFDAHVELRRRFEVELDTPEWGREWSFEGPPVIADGRMYAVVRRRDAVRSEYHVACFETRRGRLMWRRRVCAAESLGGNRPYEITHNLLTFHGDTLYCNTNLGAIAALRARDGRVRWITEYPRVLGRDGDPDQNIAHVYRDLTPCLVHHGLVIAAPRDSNRLFALDAATGHPAWLSQAEQAADAIHLLGARDDHLIVSGDFLYWFDAYDGTLLTQTPLPRKTTPGHARPTPSGYGRGYLAGDEVYWPTRDAILVFSQRTQTIGGRREATLLRSIDLASRGATGGNLVPAGDVLVIAGPGRLFAFRAIESQDVGNRRSASR